MTQAFPFSAIVGQDEVKRALLIAAVDSTIGGVLILGDRGTGKSTAIRGLAALLPPMEAISGCTYHLHPDETDWLCKRCKRQIADNNLKTRRERVPVVDLPLGATEDRVVGALDIEHALSRGEKTFEPGLLAQAHRGFLYVDEVNLLEDHIVDVLLDVAASGVNVVERDGLSIRHPARFVLIGSGNPEEGELRPQLLDRFGLSVEVTTPARLESRVDVVSRRDDFDRDPQAFIKKWKSRDAKIRKQVLAARAALNDVVVSKEVRAVASELCIQVNTDGLRGDLTLIRAARAVAALDGQTSVSKAHIATVAPSALRHRLRRDPLDDSGSSARIERALRQLFKQDAA